MAERKIWIDEKGKKVEIQPFFANLYTDEEVEKLGLKYIIWECDGESRSSTLGKSQRECLVAKVLVLVRANGDNCVHLVGVKKSELEVVLERENYHWFLDELIKEGFLREKWIMGDIVVFPTEKLLDNQKIKKVKR